MIGAEGRRPDLAEVADVARLAEVAERVLAEVPPGAEAQVHVRAAQHSLTRFANSRVHQNIALDELVVTLKLATGRRVASASTTRIYAEGLADLVRRATAAAEVRPVDPHWPGVAGPEAGRDGAPTAAHWDDATAGASPSERAAVVAAFLAEGSDGQEGAGYCDTLAASTAVATTAGLRRMGRWTRATVDGIFLTGPEGGHTPAGYGHASSIQLADIQAGSAPAGADAARLCAESRRATDLEPGEYPVVLMPECAAETLAFLADGFSAKSVQEGQSFAVPGKALFDPAISFVDDVNAPGAVGLAFDTDGTARQRVELIVAGRCGGLLHDRRTAARERAVGEPARSTGHAHLASDSWGPAPAALQLPPGRAALGDLVGGLERGLLITCFNYCRVLDPKTVEVTGLTRNGTFWVEDGRVVRPLTNLRFTQSFVEVLGPGRVEAVGAEARLADCEWGPGLVRTPPIRLSGWRFTGGAGG